MQLKRINDITADDVPYIESAFFAVGKVASARTTRFGGGLNRIANLDEMLRDGEWLNTRGRDEQRWTHLLSRVEHYAVVLVGDRLNPPFSPVFRFQPQEGHPTGGVWQACEAAHAPALQHLLRSAPASSSSTGAAAAICKDEPAPALKLAAAAPREITHDITLDVVHEHLQNLNGHIPIKNGTRYILTTDQQMVRKGVVQNGRVAESALKINSSYTLVFVAPA